MKKVLKLILLFSFALVTQNQFWQNLQFNQGIPTILKVAFILTIFELFLKPILKFLLLPINLLTFGLFRIVILTLGFYLAIFLLADFQVLPIHTPAQTIFGLSLPELNYSGFPVFIITTISANILMSLFKFIIKSPKPKK
jgi:uncharacterized membrane protein YvlD (DUF360 family)